MSPDIKAGGDDLVEPVRVAGAAFGRMGRQRAEHINGPGLFAVLAEQLRIEQAQLQERQRAAREMDREPEGREVRVNDDPNLLARIQEQLRNRQAQLEELERDARERERERDERDAPFVIMLLRHNQMRQEQAEAAARANREARQNARARAESNNAARVIRSGRRGGAPGAPPPTADPPTNGE